MHPRVSGVSIHQSLIHRSKEIPKDAAEQRLDADYQVDLERCDILSGSAKDNCVEDVKRKFGKS
jgi:hypothetical protein